MVCDLRGLRLDEKTRGEGGRRESRATSIPANSSEMRIRETADLGRDGKTGRGGEAERRRWNIRTGNFRNEME